MTIPLKIIGWKVAPDEPLELRPQFDNPVAVRVYAGAQRLGPMEARLRWNAHELLVDIDLPELPGERVTAFCMTTVEAEPITGLRRRRIHEIDVRIERHDRTSRAETGA